MSEFAWLCTVAFVYLTCLFASAYILVEDWRMMYGHCARVPWVVVWVISLLGPISLVVAIVAYCTDRMKLR